MTNEPDDVDVDDGLPMEGVQEYYERLDVRIADRAGRPVVLARNQGGYDSTCVDLIQLISWVAANRPDLLQRAVSAT